MRLPRPSALPCAAASNGNRWADGAERSPRKGLVLASSMQPCWKPCTVREAQSKSAVVLRAGAAHVPEVVSAHLEAFQGFFLTRLGSRFLARFYRAMVDSPDALVFVAMVDGNVAGFVAGTVRPESFFRRLFLRDGPGFVLAAIPALLRSPMFVARRLWRGVTYRGETPRELPGGALLSSIAVVPAYAGMGIAGALLEQFCAAAIEGGASGVFLLTDRDSNEHVNRFYLRHTFQLLQEVRRSDGRDMNLYWRPADPAAAIASKLSGGHT